MPKLLTKHIESATWPEDFKIILRSFIDEHFMGEEPRLEVEELKIADIEEDLLDEVEQWEDHDREHAYFMSQDMLRGDEFPPVIVCRNTLLDGYHRCYAARQIGRDTVMAIRFAL